jgi:hypothetical protein
MPPEGETRGVTIHLLHRNRDGAEARSDPSRYAASLHAYAAPTLDAASLRAWLVQRLMMDLGLDHAGAAELAARVLESQRAA